MSELPPSLPTVLGLVLVAAGTATIMGIAFLAGGLTFVELQLPYLIVGGCLGLGLVIFGSSLAVADQHRRHRAEVEAAAARMLVAAAQVIESRRQRRGVA